MTNDPSGPRTDVPSSRSRFPMPRDERPGARRVVLGLGSNHQAETNIPEAIEQLTYAFDLLVKSTRYVGPPEGPPEEPVPGGEKLFSNAAVLVRTADSYVKIRTKVREIENALQRDRSTPEKVTIDIDVLLIEGEVVRRDDDTVVVPHPDLCMKRHAAIPSAEVAPSLKHPGTRELIADIAARLA